MDKESITTNGLKKLKAELEMTIVFVTHGIQEAVFLGTHVAVMTPSPAKMADYFEVDLPHPRKLDVKTHENFGVYTRRIYDLLGMD